MAEYRNRTTGEIKTQGEWRREYPKTSFPRTWSQETLDFLNVDPVFTSSKPNVGVYEKVVRNGVIKNHEGNWVENWEVVSMFSEYTDEEGVTHTVAEQEAAYQARLDDEAAKSVRTQRDRLLAETDWMALSDVTMTEPWALYRQALRDITTQVGFPHNVNWPTKPE